MYVLGVSFDYHDAAATLVKDGKVICAIQEERLTRIKHDPILPKNSIRACLKDAGILPKQLDAVVFYEDPILKFDRMSKAALQSGFGGIASFRRALKNWMDGNKFSPAARLAEFLGIDEAKIHYREHHRSHADSAFLPSPFDEALSITVDGVGEHETCVVSRVTRHKHEKLSSSIFPHSLGLFYSALTAFLGFEVNEGEYKVMGMAAFGRPIFYDQLKKLIWVKNGKIYVDQSYFTFKSPQEMPFNDKLIALLGKPRTAGTDFSLSDKPADEQTDSDDRRYADIGASVQRVAEEIMLELLSYWTKKTGISDIVMAGGVALNSLANGRLQKELDIRLYIHPAAGDSGGALGAALGYYYDTVKSADKQMLKSPYLGLSYDADDVLKAVRHYPQDDVHLYESYDEMIEQTAKLISEGKVLGWMQGRFEWGPRALGCRSIIASPTFADMKDRVNRQIKFREPFRPFAPAVLAEVAHEYFDLPRIDYDCHPESYMISVCQVKESAKSIIPAIVHVDGTARVQTVYEETNPLYYKLIKRVGELTGAPVILNTSFNLKGEPIVSSPVDAIQTFEWSEMNNLVMDRVIVERPDYSNILRNRLS